MENINTIDSYAKGNKRYIIGRDSKSGLYYYYISGESEDWKVFFSLNISKSNNNYSLQDVKDYIDAHL